MRESGAINVEDVARPTRAIKIAKKIFMKAFVLLFLSRWNDLKGAREGETNLSWSHDSSLLFNAWLNAKR